MPTKAHLGKHPNSFFWDGLKRLPKWPVRICACDPQNWVQVSRSEGLGPRDQPAVIKPIGNPTAARPLTPTVYRKPAFTSLSYSVGGALVAFLSPFERLSIKRSSRVHHIVWSTLLLKMVYRARGGFSRRDRRSGALSRDAHLAEGSTGPEVRPLAGWPVGHSRGGSEVLSCVMCIFVERA